MTPNPNPSPECNCARRYDADQIEHQLACAALTAPKCPACDDTKVVSQGGHDTGCNACYVSPQTLPAPPLSTDVQSAATGFHEQDVSLKVALPAPGEVDKRDRVKAVSERLLTRMREYARQDGWALAVHGSMCRDLDVIAVPWTDTASDTCAFVEAMRAAVASELGGTAISGAGEDGRTAGFKFKPNGRRCYTLHSTSEQLVEDETGAHPYVDLSVLDLRGKPDTIAFVQDWLMNADYDPTQFDKDFAAAIDARSLATVAAANDEGVAEAIEALEDIAEHAETRIKDGKDLGANIWKIALEDTVRDARAAIRLLSQGEGE